MHGAQAGIGQRQSAEQARHGHLRPGFPNPLIRARQGARGAAHAFHAEEIGHGVGARGDVGFDQLRQRVEAGGGGDGGGQVERQFGVHHGQARQHQGTAQAGLHAVFRGGQHGVARHLRARPRGGRDGDEGHGRTHERLPFADNLQVIQRIAAVGEERGDGFAGIDGAAAAEGDDHAAAGVARQPDAFAHQIDGRLGGGFEPGAGKTGDRRGALARAPRDHQRAPAELLHRGRHFAHHSGPEQDAAGGGEFEAHHQPSSPGKTFENFTPARGSAIMGATASRQVW